MTKTENPPGPTPEDYARAFAEHSVRGRAADLAATGVDISPILDSIEPQAETTADQAWAKHVVDGDEGNQPTSEHEHTSTYEKIYAMLNERAGIIGDVYLPGRGVRIEGLAEYRYLQRQDVGDNHPLLRNLRTTGGHTKVANEKGGLCLPFAKDKPDHRLAKRFEQTSTTEIITLPESPLPQREQDEAPTYGKVDSSSQQSSEALWMVSYDTGPKEGTLYRGVQWRIRFYLPESDARELHKIANESPESLRDAMREATQSFMRRDVYVNSEVGERDFERDRPPYEQWAEQGIDGFAIRSSFDAGPEQSRLFTRPIPQSANA